MDRSSYNNHHRGTGNPGRGRGRGRGRNGDGGGRGGGTGWGGLAQSGGQQRGGQVGPGGGSYRPQQQQTGGQMGHGGGSYRPQQQQQNGGQGVGPARAESVGGGGGVWSPLGRSPFIHDSIPGFMYFTKPPWLSLPPEYLDFQKKIREFRVSMGWENDDIFDN